MDILETILGQMSSVNKAQRNFIAAILMNLIYVRGKANFRNLSRYGDYHEVFTLVYSDIPILLYYFHLTKVIYYVFYVYFYRNVTDYNGFC
jgi:hypothetical protein